MRHLKIRAEILAKMTMGYDVRVIDPDWIVTLQIQHGIDLHSANFQRGDVIEFEYDFPDDYATSPICPDKLTKIGRAEYIFIPEIEVSVDATTLLDTIRDATRKAVELRAVLDRIQQTAITVIQT